MLQTWFLWYILFIFCLYSIWQAMVLANIYNITYITSCDFHNTKLTRHWMFREVNIKLSDHFCLIRGVEKLAFICTIYALFSWAVHPFTFTNIYIMTVWSQFGLPLWLRQSKIQKCNRKHKSVTMHVNTLSHMLAVILGRGRFVWITWETWSFGKRCKFWYFCLKYFSVTDLVSQIFVVIKLFS